MDKYIKASNRKEGEYVLEEKMIFDDLKDFLSEYFNNIRQRDQVKNQLKSLELASKTIDKRINKMQKVIKSLTVKELKKLRATDIQYYNALRMVHPELDKVLEGDKGED